MTRKIILILNVFLLAATQLLAGRINGDPVIEAIRHSAPVVLQSSGSTTKEVELVRQWSGSACRLELVNHSASAISLKEVVLFTAARLFPPDTKIYGEGFQMLSQTAGTLGNPVDLGHYTDREHYRMPEPPGYRVLYDLLSLIPAGKKQYLLGFTSANRFIGKFYLSADSIKVVMDLEDLIMPSGASWKLEDFYLGTGAGRSALFEELATAIQRHHPRRALPVATGWCSWYCFGPEVTPKNIYDNLATIKEKVPQLKYIQLDDGYQASMGDWLSPGPSFDGGIKKVLLKIKAQGFEPAVWVAPFICDSNSSVFKLHKDWLVKDSIGNPLRSDRVGFGGWRRAPWYVLDGTNPAVQRHLEAVFSTMRKEWGCTYFKLDANYWGALPGGHYFRPAATRTQAYRLGMEAILRGAGRGSFILGCNQPNWPSLGLVHGARTSMDISRDWETIVSTGRENLYRSWQNGKLWWNDPDCLLLTGHLPDNEFMYHVALIYATGGMLLSGDDIALISPERLAILKKLSASAGTAARFDDDGFTTGWTTRGETKTLVVLNASDTPRHFRIPVAQPVTLYDFFSGKKMGRFEKEISLPGFAVRTGALYEVRKD